MVTREDLNAVLAQIATELQAAEDRVEDLHRQRVGVEAVMTRLHLLPSTTTLRPQGPEESFPISRAGGSGLSALVADILREHPDGLHLTQIRARAEQRGHTIDSEQVRGGVAYLKRVRRAERRGPGIWRLISSKTSDPIDAESPTVDAVRLSVPFPMELEGGGANGTGTHRVRDDPSAG